MRAPIHAPSMSKSSKRKGGGDSLYKGMGIKLENIVIGDTLGATLLYCPLDPTPPGLPSPSLPSCSFASPTHAPKFWSVDPVGK